MELKQQLLAYGVEAEKGFNRTFMELKPVKNQALVAVSCASFNRTFMELKHPRHRSLYERGHAF